ADRARVAQVGSAAVGGAADRVALPAGGTELADQRAASGVHVTFVVVSNVGSSPAVELALELAVPFLEERPVEITFVAHGDRKAGATRSARRCPARVSPAPSISVALEARLPLRHEGMIGAAEVLRHHADRLRLCLGVDGFINAHRP